MDFMAQKNLLHAHDLGYGVEIDYGEGQEMCK